MRWILPLLLVTLGCYHNRSPQSPGASQAFVEAPRWKVQLAVQSALDYFGIPVQEVGSTDIKSGSFLVKGYWALDPAGERIRCYAGGRPLRVRSGDDIRLSAVVEIEQLTDSLNIISITLEGRILAVPMLGTAVGGGRCEGAPEFAQRLAEEMKKRGEVYVVRKGILLPRDYEHRAIAAELVQP